MADTYHHVSPRRSAQVQGKSQPHVLIAKSSLIPQATTSSRQVLDCSHDYCQSAQAGSRRMHSVLEWL
eukprot:933212-Amphidinium_carterae.1